jgi:predicted nuclease with TOPRIM domain
MSKYLLLVILLMGAAGYWYYTDTQKRMAILQENNAKLEVAVETQKQTLEKQQEDIARISAEKSAVAEEFAASRQSVEELRGKFNKVSKLLGARDIGKLGAAKPDSISKIVTKGSNEVMRCFEILAGAPLTEKEENAEKPSQINKQCPDIANPKYIPGS